MKVFDKISLRIVFVLSIASLFLFNIGTIQALPTITATLKATPETYSGPCPAVIKFEGEITAKNIGKPPLKVQYKFIRSDGAFAPVHTLTFDKDGSKKVNTTWTLGGPSLPTYEGWEAIKVVYPQDVESNHADFKMECKAAPAKQEPARPGLPDLKVVHTDHQPAGDVSTGKTITFKVTVKNMGTGVALGTVKPDGSTTPDGYMIDLSLSKDPIRDPVKPHVVPSPYSFAEGMLLKGGRISRTEDLAPGASKEYSASVELPKDIKPGKYWIGVSLDPFNKVAEGPPTGESDNAVNHGITMIVPTK